MDVLNALEKMRLRRRSKLNGKLFRFKFSKSISQQIFKLVWDGADVTRMNLHNKFARKEAKNIYYKKFQLVLMKREFVVKRGVKRFNR